MAGAATSTWKRGRRLFAIAAGLACVGGAFRVDTAPAVTTSPPMQTAAARDGADLDGVPAPSTGMPPRAAPRASDADAPCDLTAPEPVTTQAQDAQDTETQARYDLMLARRLRATGNLVDQAVGSLLGRPEDGSPGEMSGQVGEVARAAVLTSDAELYALAPKACARVPEGSESGAARCLRPARGQPAGIAVELGWSTDRLSAARSKARTMFAAVSSLARFPPHDCRADVQLAILAATLASDAPMRLDVPRLRSAVDTMTRKRSDEAVKVDAEREAAEAEERTAAPEAGESK